MTVAISLADYRCLKGLAEPLEADFQASVMELAGVHGWLAFHPHDSRRSVAGFPDLTLVRANRLLFAEVKRSARHKLAEAQAAWLAALDQAEHVSAHVWRPSDWNEIERLLR